MNEQLVVAGVTRAERALLHPNNVTGAGRFVITGVVVDQADEV